MAKYSLPQDSKNDRRVPDLDGRRKDYGYNFQYQVPVGTKSYPRDFSSPSWAAKVLKALMATRSNVQAILDETDWKFTKKLPTFSPKDLASYLVNLDFPNLFEYYWTDLGPMVGGGRPTSLADYEKIFRKAEKVYTTERFMEDAYFAHSFVAGPHASAFEVMTSIPANFPINDTIFRKTKEFSGDDLGRAISAGRVFIVDYKAMVGMDSGMHPLQKKYIYQPIAALAVPEGGKNLVPLAIQCGQNPVESQIFSPKDEWAWNMAKAVTWCAHYTYHEIISHLGLTHLLLEPMVVATRRQLHESHPIYGLLDPHFEGTMLINKMAVKDLIQDGQAVDRLTGSTNASNFKLLAQERLGYSFTKNYLPQRLKNKGLASSKTLPTYHYRDDGIQIWNAVRTWAGKYVDRYYKDDSAIRADMELQAWAAEIASQEGGRVRDFAANGGVDTKDQLIDTCTMIIFTSGPQHAAVNFPQLTDMSFIPGGPLAGYRAHPENVKMQERDFLDILPPLDVALKQWQTMFLLGSVYHTTLGQYDKNNFDDPVIKVSADKFRSDLNKVEDDIKDRNKSRMPYEHLLPSKIPQSVNI